MTSSQCHSLPVVLEPPTLATWFFLLNCTQVHDLFSIPLLTWVLVSVNTLFLMLVAHLSLHISFIKTDQVLILSWIEPSPCESITLSSVSEWHTVINAALSTFRLRLNVNQNWVLARFFFLMSSSSCFFQVLLWWHARLWRKLPRYSSIILLAVSGLKFNVN